MKKSKSIVFLTIIIVLIVVATVFTVTPFQVGVYDYKSVAGAIKLGIDLKGGYSAVLEPELESGKTVSDYEINQAIDILQSRLTNKGFTEATVAKQTSLGQELSKTFIRVEIPGVSDPDEVMDVIGKTAKLTFHLGQATVGQQVPSELKVALTGADIERATAGITGGQNVVSLKFTSEGSKKFADATASQTGNYIAIAVDNVCISSPSVKESITGGNAVIEGIESFESAENLALQINSGALPFSFKSIAPTLISPTLGQDALFLGLIAGGIGLLLVFIFMIVMYRGLGLVADLALIIYTLLVLFFLAALPWVQLSIQGIAGIILSIGMAVDANVIIFERIKDEYKSGKSLKASVKAGFRRATSAIIDGNVTTIIASVVLWIFGAGAIKGFGITLFIGIVISLITSLLITRLLVSIFLGLTKKEKFYRLKRNEEVEEI